MRTEHTQPANIVSWPCCQPKPANPGASNLLTRVLALQRAVPVVLHRVVGATWQQLGDYCSKGCNPGH